MRGAYLEFAAHGGDLALQSTGFELHRDPSVEANWRTALTSTLCAGVLRDLPPLRPCWVRVRALAGQSFGPWSALASVVVL